MLLVAHQQGHKATTFVAPAGQGGAAGLARYNRREPRWSTRWRSTNGPLWLRLRRA